MSSNQQVHADSVPTAKLDAHDIANRIMRQENYLIALFNKELLDLRVPIPAMMQPYLGRILRQESKQGQVLTRALEWNLRFCLMGYLFDHGGRVRQMFLREKNRTILIERCVRLQLLDPYVLSYSRQPPSPIRLHGNSECNIRTIHRPLLAHVFVFPLL